MGKTLKLPKTKCCVSKSRCGRCPIRMLKDGDLPSGYGVHKRALVKVGSSTKITKTELAKAVKNQKKKSGKKKSLAA